MFDNAEKLNDKDLEQVSGGFIVYTGWQSEKHPNQFEVIMDPSGVSAPFKVERETLEESRAAAKQAAENLGMSSKEITWWELQKLRENNQ